MSPKDKWRLGWKGKGIRGRGQSTIKDGETELCRHVACREDKVLRGGHGRKGGDWANAQMDKAGVQSGESLKSQAFLTPGRVPRFSGLAWQSLAAVVYRALFRGVPGRVQGLTLRHCPLHSLRFRTSLLRDRDYRDGANEGHRTEAERTVRDREDGEKQRHRERQQQTQKGQQGTGKNHWRLRTETGQHGPDRGWVKQWQELDLEGDRQERKPPGSKGHSPHCGDERARVRTSAPPLSAP